MAPANLWENVGRYMIINHYGSAFIGSRVERTKKKFSAGWDEAVTIIDDTRSEEK